MIRKLVFRTRFTSSGKVYEGKHDFGKGLTAIVGPNESGKSLVLEMIRYALFGTQALRAPLKEYQELRTELSFEVKGDTYRIERSKGKALLHDKDKIVATGTDPVNLSIHRLLGFGLLVFDTVLASLQDESQKLTEMTPSARKQMVDSLTGLQGIQEVVAECRRRSTTAKNMVAGLKEGYIAPEEPTPPDNLKSIDLLKQERDVVRDCTNRVNHCNEVLLNEVDNPGPQPQLPPYSSIELTGALSIHRKLCEEITEQEQVLARNPKPSYTREELEEQKDLLLVQALDQKHPAPPLSRSEIENQLVMHGELSMIKRKEELQRKLEELQDDGSTECPSCGTEFYLQHNLVSQYEEELDNLAHVSTDRTPYRDLHKAQALSEWLKRWDAREEHPELSAPFVEPQLTRQELDRQYQLLVFDREGALKRLRELKDHLDPTIHDRYRDAVVAEGEYTIWRERADRHNDWVTKSKQARIDLNLYSTELRNHPPLEELEESLEEAIEYEALLDNYEAQKVRADKVLKRIEEEAQKQADWKTASQVVSQFSLEVKSYLLPSLSHVASSLMHVITGGARSEVKIDKDFEIFVDKQPVNTLSGSAKVAINLALRVGLGQVLTSSTFPVFLADEIDASMDDTRAASTVECIRNLSKTMQQVVLVSHKPVVEADHYLRMG